MLSSWSILYILILSAVVSALPFPFKAPVIHQRRSIELPITRRRIARNDLAERDTALAGTVGIGDLADL